jgi:hypothetical protein
MTTDVRTLKDELLQQERAYLEAVQSKDGAAAQRLTAPESLVVGGRGAMKVDGAAIRGMVEQHDASRRYEIDESTAQVVRLTDDVAIISYTLRTRTGAETWESYDTDVWTRRDGRWLCALHTEVPAEAA